MSALLPAIAGPNRGLKPDKSPLKLSRFMLFNSVSRIWLFALPSSTMPPDIAALIDEERASVSLEKVA